MKFSLYSEAWLKSPKNNLRKMVWSELISWVEKVQLPEKAKTRGKAREVLVACSMFDSTVFKMKDGVLMFTKAAYKNQVGEVGRIFIPASMVREAWSLCHQSDLAGHRGLERTLNKFIVIPL